jgi:gamma-glutamylcyclotransferase (GGCT)/AIG2-like uncharacterized protein YtfP
MQHLFAYGTLMCEDIMTAVVRVPCRSAPATLTGYRRLCVRGEDYPALVPNEGGHVEGLVYYDIPELAWVRLNCFEGSMYEREQVHVEVDEGEKVSAVTYVLLMCCIDQLEAREWSFEMFLREGKTRFVNSLRGYR